MKSTRGTARLWVEGFLKKYTRGHLPDFAIRRLCLKQQRWTGAEIKYGKNKASGNLLTHVETTLLEGHKDARRVCKGLPPADPAETAGPAETPSKTVKSDGANTTMQSALTQSFKFEAPSATRELCKMIVMEYLPLSVRAFRGVTGFSMLKSEPLNEGDPIVFHDPPPWWKLHARSFSSLARVARRVLAIPANSA